MTENMKAFLDAVSNNEELKGKVNEINKKEQEELKGHIAEYIALAKEAGINLTEEDFRQDNSTEISDEELQAVAGGSKMVCALVGAGQGCFCVLVGGSSAGQCVSYGETDMEWF